MCVDYRLLNKITEENAYPIPKMMDLFNHQGGLYFTALDLWSGYNQIGLTPRAQKRSAFVTPFGHYEYTRMSFGLCNAPATFQQAMNDIFEDMIGHGVQVYIDDIMIYANTWEEHNQLLERVLTRIRKTNLRIKSSKCFFGMHQVEYLGFIIEGNTIRTNPKKIAAIEKFPQPSEPSDVRAFLGLVQFYRRFIKNFAFITSPLNMLLRKARKWKWDKAQQKSFEMLKERMTQAPILVRPDFTKTFKLYTDASKFGFGAILVQDSEEGERVIAYASRGTRNAEPNYGLTKLECAAAV